MVLYYKSCDDFKMCKISGTLLVSWGCSHLLSSVYENHSHSERRKLGNTTCSERAKKKNLFSFSTETLKFQLNSLMKQFKVLFQVI